MGDWGGPRATAPPGAAAAAGNRRPAAAAGGRVEVGSARLPPLLFLSHLPPPALQPRHVVPRRHRSPGLDLASSSPDPGPLTRSVVGVGLYRQFGWEGPRRRRLTLGPWLVCGPVTATPEGFPYLVEGVTLSPYAIPIGELSR